jgi:hypothetical protein
VTRREKFYGLVQVTVAPIVAVSLCRIELPVIPNQFVGDECHIIGQKTDGPRGSDSDRESIDECENLILLCKTHHKLVDDQQVNFSVKFLRALKIIHESWVKESLGPLKQKGQQPKIWLLDRIRTGKELMAVFGGVCTHLLDLDEPNTEQEMELLGNFLQEVQDWIDAWNDIESSDRVQAAFELSKKIKELEAADFYVFALPVKQRVKLNDKAELWPSGILTVVRQSNPGITALGQLATFLKVGANSFPSD